MPPKFVREDLWEPTDLWVVTTNSVVNSQGLLVMGAGAAEQAAVKYPGLAKEAGIQVTAVTHILQSQEYCFLPMPGYPIGLFQTKVHWRDLSTIQLIRKSTLLLNLYCTYHPEMRIRMNFPGIGLGGLMRKKQEIRKVLEVLPDTVTVCYT